MIWASNPLRARGSLASFATRGPTGSVPCSANNKPSTKAARVVILLLVSVPVLSVQMVVAEPLVSQEHRVLTKLFSFVILFDINARAMTRARGKPSGIAQARMPMVCKTMSKIFL